MKKYIPNFITFCRIALTPICIISILNQFYILALAVMFVIAISDFLDGFLARRFNSISAYGKKLDEIADKIVCLSLGWFLIVINTPLSIVLISLLTIRDLAISFLRFKKIIPITQAPSLTAKTKTFLLYLLLLIIIANLSFHFIDSGNIKIIIVLDIIELMIGYLSVHSFISYLSSK